MDTPYDQDAGDEPDMLSEEQAEFVLSRFVDLLESEGGQELPDRCTPRYLPLPGKPAATNQGCGNQTLFKMHYATEGGELSSITACAICDGGLRWPRIVGKLADA